MFCLAAPQSISGQNAATPVALVESKEIPPQLQSLVDELTEQNKQLVANQAAMEAKIDTIAESVRQARLFAARGAGKGAK